MAVEIEMWVFSVETGIAADPTAGIDVTGFGVEALDGGIGKVDEATYEEGAHGLVVDTGHWIFGKKVVLPAGVIERVDEKEKKVYVDRTKDQIKSSPKFGEIQLDAEARGEVGRHYAPGGAGHPGS
ncbi:MAG: PRC-barrel domain containing protein [Solirubrobacterales bacterium]